MAGGADDSPSSDVNSRTARAPASRNNSPSASCFRTGTTPPPPSCSRSGGASCGKIRTIIVISTLGGSSWSVSVWDFFRDITPDNNIHSLHDTWDEQIRQHNSMNSPAPNFPYLLDLRRTPQIVMALVPLPLLVHLHLALVGEDEERERHTETGA